MHDIVFCSLPYSNLDSIYNAPAILKGVVLEHGYTAKTIDFGCELLKLCNKDADFFYKIQNYFITSEKLHSADDNKIIEKFYDLVIFYIKANPSKFIAFSAFSIYTHKSILEILIRIKKEKIESKIIIGGRGAKVPIYKEAFDNEVLSELTTIDTTINFAQLLKKKGLIDHFIIGDGEEAIVDLLQNKVSIDNHDNTSESFKTPVPDYSDYNFNDYLFHDNKIQLPVTGSKGCVRDCDFCDIKFQFGKYRFRSGSDIANEIIELSQKFDVYDFIFTDSLVNGSLKVFREFMQILSDYNLQNPEKKISWSGAYICRLPEQIPKDLYKLMQQSGAKNLTIGAESGSNHVLKHMNKKTTVEALYTELEQFRLHGITCFLLTFVGHWSERWEDFIAHCNMFIKIKPYVASNTVINVQLGIPMAMLDGTPSLQNAAKNNIIISDFSPGFIWKQLDNPSNTFKERVYRRLILTELLKKLKIPTALNLEVYAMITNTVVAHSDQIEKFYE